MGLNLTKEQYLKMRVQLRKHSIGGFCRPVTTREQKREKLAALMKSRRLPDGKVAVFIWQRDCDMCEWTTVRYIPCSPMAYEKLEDSTHDYAEGPVSMHIMRPEDAAEFKPECRDRIAEAWDNGNTSAYYV